ncbi:MAG: 50S ribosomal protein L11 methyltransferase [Candidatus Zixiibacteriota bacterium]
MNSESKESDRSVPAEYSELSIKVPARHVDAVCDYIIEHVTSGLLLEDKDGSQFTRIVFYVSAGAEFSFFEPLTNFVKAMFEIDGEPVPAIDKRTVRNIEWEEHYRRSVRPRRIGEDIFIRPPWCDADRKARYDIVIEPKMAFGTGEHETTAGCLQMVCERMRAGWRFLDVGCGTGILSILAARMSAGYVKAVDYDPIAVDNCRENFRINCVECEHDILCGSIEVCTDDRPYDFVCANIIRETIVQMMPQLIQLTLPGGNLVLSGLLERDRSEVEAALNGEGQSIRSVIQKKEWLTILIDKV